MGPSPFFEDTVDLARQLNSRGSAGNRKLVHVDVEGEHRDTGLSVMEIVGTLELDFNQKQDIQNNGFPLFAHQSCAGLLLLASRCRLVQDNVEGEIIQTDTANCQTNEHIYHIFPLQVEETVKIADCYFDRVGIML